jgi:superfamily II DNA or RNA helicase
MTFALRQYQEESIAEARDLFRAGAKSVLLQGATGSGKTALSAFSAGTASRRGWRVWFVVHRRELIKQSVRTFSYVGIPHGVIAAGFEADRRPLTQICSVQTVARRLERLEPPDLIIWDECHHLAAGTWSAIYDTYPDTKHLGLSATPERLDGTGLGRWFEAMVQGPSVAWLIEHGYLSPYRLYAPNPVDLSKVHTKLGDFVKGEVSAIMDRPTITGDAIAHYQRLAAGKRAVAFCCSIEHSQHVVAQAQAAGIRAAHVDGETPSAERDLAIQKFEAGEIEFLSNVDLFGEGVDIPGIEVVISLRPTQSLALCLQQWGRGLRPAEGKREAIILDHANNSQRHGLPDDDRVWTLAGRRKKRSTEGIVPVRQCPKCFAMLPAAVNVCRYCSTPLAGDPREVEERDGELVEVNKDELRRQRSAEQIKRGREQRLAGSLEGLIELGRARGYKNPERWANYVWEGRQKKAGRAA